MKNLYLLLILSGFVISAQVPVAAFSISPNPLCAQNTLQVTDLSSNSPTSWSYTFTSAGPGTFTSVAQNPNPLITVPGIYTITLVASNSSGASTPVVQTLTVLPSPFVQMNPQQVNTCPGGSPVTLNLLSGGPGGANTFLWSTGAVTSSITVNPTITTLFTATITGANGCSVQRTATVNIATATINIAGVPVNLCPGSSSTLTATGTQPGPFTYSWSTGSTTRTITTNVPGVYSVTVVNSNGCSATQSYTLGTSTTLSLTAISNPSILCAGSTATIRATGASSYSWSNGATTANATVNPVSATTYTVVGSFGTCTGTAIVTVPVNVTPTILVSSTPSTLCAGSSALLNATGAANYTWSTGSNGNSVNVTPSVSTTYTLRGSNDGCPTRTASVFLNVVPNPVLSVNSSSTIICAGEAAALAVSGATSYSWNTGSSSPVIVIMPVTTTTYTVTGTGPGGCSSTATISQLVSECTGLSIIENPELNIYPNPAIGSFVISGLSKMQVDIYDQLGVLSAHFESTSGKIECLSMAPGIYFIVASSAGTQVTKKVVVMR